jgi:hypothetical protein
LANLSGTIAEILQFFALDLSVLLHQLDARDRLNCPDENRFWLVHMASYDV